MGFRKFNFRPDYNKTDNDIAEEFYIPAMQNAVSYDRISGYFGSTVYIIVWSALQEFVEHGGKMRIICSPVISEKDKSAMAEGYSAKNDETLQQELDTEMDSLFADSKLEKPARVLACLIAEGILDIKIAVPETGLEPDLQRLFHDKVGIFTDENGDSVGFRGSMNETYQGLSDDGNLESIDVFPSWLDHRDAFRAKNAISYFKMLWTGSEAKARVYSFPEALRKKLIEKSNGYNWRELTKEISTTISLSRKWIPDKKHSTKKPREHQIKALENWVKNNRKGILEHATGSGKTYTAICAIRDALDRGQTVLVPSKELLYQWREEIRQNITDIKLDFLLCGDGNNTWRTENLLTLWTRPNSTLNKITIAVMDTASDEKFISRVVSGSHLLLVADEVHRIGSRKRRNILKIDAGERLGLSATPVRYGDPEGTAAVFDYFDGIVAPVFTLEDAIKSEVLTRYYYYPQKVHLLPDEQNKWNDVTKKINRLMAILRSKNVPFKAMMATSPKLQMLLINRARIVKQAYNKINLALGVIEKHYEPGQKWIVYCDNQGQLSDVLKLLLKNGYDAYEYFSEMQGDRVQTLKYFESNGGILVSIRCLDEGVDIPSTTHALILASSKNPREFIQRRGRILRKYPGKYFAELYDAIVMPERSLDDEDDSSSIIAGELSRAIQFGEWAENPTCIAELKIIAREYGIDYDELKNRGVEDDEEES